MITEEKIKQIKKQLSRGLPEGEIRETLKQEGYTKEDIDLAFIPHQYDMRSWYLIFGISILLFSIWIFLRTGRILLFSLSAGLFYAYFMEIKRLRKIKTPRFDFDKAKDKSF
jgi:hypothetical protein